MLRPHQLLAASLLFSTVHQAFAQVGSPDLRYAAPANFYKSAARNPEDYSSNQVNASMQVYPFRRFAGDIGQQFQRSLLRDWIDPRYQESNVAAPPQFSRVNLAGAQAAFVVRFVENVAGTMKEHMRVVIVSNGMAAVADLSANSAVSWRTAAPEMLASLNSMAVVDAASEVGDVGRATPPVPGNADASFAGVYQGIKQRFISGIYGMPGTSRYEPALHYYLLSPDGRMYRTYQEVGDGRSFNFSAAQRNDPENFGRWARRGNQLVLQIGDEQLIAALNAGGGFTIGGVSYSKER